MGNEMGNNVSELQEAENRTVKSGENYLQEDGRADDVKEENQAVPAVEDTDFHERDSGLESGDGNQNVPAVGDTNFLEKFAGLACGEGNQILPQVEETSFHEKITELAADEEHQTLPAVEDIDFHENHMKLSSDDGNQTDPAIEDQDIHEKVTLLVSDDEYGDEDHCIDYQTSDGIEQDESKVQPPPGSPQIVIESEDGNIEIRIQEDPLSADNYENDEILIKTNLDDELLEPSEKQIERHVFTEGGEEETRSSSCINSAPNSPEHLRYAEPYFDLRELAPLIENQTKTIQKSEEILGLSQSDAEVVHTLPGSVGSDSNSEIEKKMEEMASSEELDTSTDEDKAEISDEDEVPKGSSRTSSASGKNSDEEPPLEMIVVRNGSMDMDQDATMRENGDGGSPGDMNFIRNGSLEIQEESKGNNGDDEGLPVEMNVTPNLQPEAIPMPDALNPFQKVSEPEPKCMVLTDDPKDDLYELFPTQLWKESEFFCSHHEKDGKDGNSDTSCSSAMVKDFQVDEAKVHENSYKVHSCDSSPNSTWEEEELCSLSELDILPTDLIVIDCNHQGKDPTEKKMVEEILVKTELSCTVELETNKPAGQELPENTKRTVAVAQLETADQSNKQCGKDETREREERVSTESSTESLSIQAEMRKSPSFHFELLAEGSTEDSDQTPLLYHDKTMTGSLSRGADENFRNPVGEEESQKLEKCDSDKSRTPFISFLKEEDEARLVASQKNQDAVAAEKKAPEQVWDSTSPKRRTKRRSRSSLFSTCICCATAIS